MTNSLGKRILTNMVVLRDKITGRAIPTHAMTQTRFYNIYTLMRARCNRKTDMRYGGRGIKCEWKSFEEFYHDMYSSYIDGLSIERINNDGNYYKGNCKWATKKEQASNRRSNKFYTYKNETKTLKQWAEFFNVNYKKVWERINRYNWSFEKALLN